jgi:hypothetical protein
MNTAPTPLTMSCSIKIGQTFVKGLSKPVVDTEEAALNYLFQGDTNRTIAEHCLNNASTRYYNIRETIIADRRPSTLNICHIYM